MRIARTTYYDANVTNIVASNGSGTGAIIPVFTRDQEIVLKIHSYNGYPAVSNFADVVSWKADIGSVGRNSLVQATNTAFNIHADWSACNTAAGRVCFRGSLDAAVLDSDIGTSVYKTYFCTVTGTDSGGLSSPLMNIPMTIINIVNPETGMSSSSSGDSSASSDDSSQGSSASSASSESSSQGSSGSSSSGGSSLSSSSQTE